MSKRLNYEIDVASALRSLANKCGVHATPRGTMRLHKLIDDFDGQPVAETMWDLP